jgi:pilus assembly protein CpaC
MKRMTRTAGSVLLALAALLMVALPLGAVSAQPAVSVEINNTKHAGEFVVAVNKSQILRLNKPFKDVAIANPKIADVLPLTTKSLYVLGKGIGSTTLMIYGPKKTLLAVLDLVVTYDIEGLKSRLFEFMPEQGIEVRGLGDAIVLSGLVSTADKISQAATVAEHFAPGKVVNMMKVEGSQQVMLAVRFAEVSRSVTKALGVDLTYKNDSGNFGFSSGTLTGPFPFIGAIGGAASPLGAFGAVAKTTSNLAILITALEEKGLVKTLAEPNLIAMSGDTASFLAGGEFPIPVAQSGTGGDATITIEFKEFGVGLAFTPTVLDDDRINLVVAPEVSTLDFSVASQGVPGLTTRRAETTVELRDGQTFAIAGLLQNNFSSNIDQTPWLGDIPILGPLFRSSSFQRDETELIILVTPFLVRPAAAAAMATPVDRMIPPSETDLFLQGRLEALGSGLPPTDSAGVLRGTQNGGLIGQYGYIIK